MTDPNSNPHGNPQVPQNPPGQQYPPHPHPGPQPPQTHNPWNNYPTGPHGPGPQGNPHPPRRRRSRWLTIGVPLGLAAALFTAVGILAIPDSASTDNTATGNNTGIAPGGVNWEEGKLKEYPDKPPGLPPGGDFTDAELARVDPEILYWTMLKKQSTHQVTDYSLVRYSTEREYKNEFPGGDARRIGIDYPNRQFLSESTERDDAGNIDPKGVTLRCVDGKTLFYAEETGQWSPVEQQGPEDECGNRLVPGKVVANVYTSDGVAAGGLTDDEANRFVSYLDNIDGLFTMDTPVRVEDDKGKSYIQMDVRLNQLDPRDSRNVQNIATGVGFLEAAFAKTGKDALDHPYSVDIGNTEGRQMRYYIDPDTFLPAYMVSKSVKPVTVDGKPINHDKFRTMYQLFQYSFPQELEAAAMGKVATPILTFRPWPFEQTVFP